MHRRKHEFILPIASPSHLVQVKGCKDPPRLKDKIKPHEDIAFTKERTKFDSELNS